MCMSEGENKQPEIVVLRRLTRASANSFDLIKIQHKILSQTNYFERFHDAIFASSRCTNSSAAYAIHSDMVLLHGSMILQIHWF